MSDSRPVRAGLALGLSLLMALGGAAEPAGAGTANQTVKVFKNVLKDQMTYQPLPGASVQLTAGPGQRFILYSDPFSLTVVQRMPAWSDLGTTTGLFCPPRNSSAPNGTHYATNLATANGFSTRPLTRWVFTAPHTSGTRRYTCKVAIAFYTKGQLGTKDVRATAPGGTVRLHAAPAPLDTRHWTQQPPFTAVRAGATPATVLTHSWDPAPSSPRLAIRQDVQLTMCKRRSSYAACPRGSHAHSDVSTWIEAQPLNAAGAACGTLVRSAVRNLRITEPEHHLTVLNTLDMAQTALPKECSRLRLSLRVQVRAGNAALVHGGTAGNGEAATAYSHGFAYTYGPTSSAARGS
ncbi:hypothetical protein ABZ445_40650 [Streptomyces chartreusis]|uniref:hypothetical protein n=1 Tax=Streptomyces chartreusis TaxID=1969 RepID=UPI0033F1110D